MPTTDRRQFLTTTAAALGAAALPPTIARADTPAGPPVARTVDHRGHRFALTLPDSYRWMQDAHDPDWEPYMRGPGVQVPRGATGLSDGYVTLIRRARRASANEA